MKAIRIILYCLGIILSGICIIIGLFRFIYTDSKFINGLVIVIHIIAIYSFVRSINKILGHVEEEEQVEEEEEY